MPLPHRTYDALPAEPAQPSRPAARPAPARAPGEPMSVAGPIVFVESPARLLLDQLSSRLEPASDAVIDDRWPGAVRLAFIGVATLLLWTLIVATVLAF